MNPESSKSEFWATAAGAIILVVVLFAFRAELGPILHGLEAAVARAGPVGPLVFVLVYAVWATLCLPGPLMLAAAGTLFASRPLVAISCIWLGDALAQAVAFQVARRWARQRIEAWLGDKPWFSWLQAQISKQGARAVFTVRLMPFFPNSLANYAFGLTPLSFWPYLLASVAGSLPNTALYVGGAAGVVHLVKHPVWEHDILIGLGVTLALLGLTYLALRTRRAEVS
ncbi:MAG: TVP38/TMEM64 family protein [Candidatus Eremiobacteraeota bacterium]|nr:TVP38/TMEM64 family protein [Candidatus Eremiobacteraeota bacterium]